jgi:hypothetical protein
VRATTALDSSEGATKHRQLPRALAKEYAARLGLAWSSQRSEKHWGTRSPVQRGQFWGLGEPEWRTLAGGPAVWEVAAGIAGQRRIAARACTHVRHLTIDLDVHQAPPAEACEATLEQFLEAAEGTGRAGAARAETKALRAWRAPFARPVVEQLRALIGDAALLVEWTPRGWHVSVLLADVVDGREAASLAAAIVARLRVPEGCSVEAFPKCRADGKVDHCALPLLGTQRRCAPDLVTAAGMREAAVRELVAMQGVGVAELRAIVGTRPEAAAAPSAVPPSEPAEADVIGQLFKSDFVAECLELVANGIPLGGSYSAVRRVYAAARYCGHAHPAVRSIVEAWLARPIHSARHCGSQRGRRQLLRLVDAQGRHFDRGLRAGRVREDGLRSRELRREFADLRRHHHGEEFPPCDTSPLPIAATPPTPTAGATAATAPSSSSPSPRSSCPTSASSSPSAGTPPRESDAGASSSRRPTTPSTRQAVAPPSTRSARGPTEGRFERAGRRGERGAEPHVADEREAGRRGGHARNPSIPGRAFALDWPGAGPRIAEALGNELQARAGGRASHPRRRPAASEAA